MIAYGERIQWSVPDCACLLADHERLKQEYARAVDVLFATGYRIPDRDHARLKNSIEEARVQVDLARRRLDQHNLAAHSKAV